MVVKSRQKGLYQHDGLSWEVMGGSFVYLDDVTENSKRTERVLKEWVAEMTTEQREQFIDALYQLLSSDNALTLTDLASPKNRWLIRGKELDPQVHQTIQKTVSALISLNTKNILSDLFPKKNMQSTSK